MIGDTAADVAAGAAAGCRTIRVDRERGFREAAREAIAAVC